MKSQHATQIRRCATEWFKDHRATFATENKDVQLLNWHKPGTGIYCLRYIICGSYLCVIGDAGDAVYQWSERITWDFLKETDMEYFVSKCQASEVGRSFVQWDAHKLAKDLEHWLRERQENEEEKMPEGDMREFLRAARSSSCQQEWCEVAAENTEILGEDWHEFADLGETLNVRAIGHWVGLQMATGNTENMLKRYEE